MSSVRKKITLQVVKSLGPKAVIWDTAISGFCVRRQKGKPSYAVKTRVNGVQRWITIGQHGVFTPDQARREAQLILADAKRGVDRGAQKKEAREGLTLSKAIDRFIDNHVETQLKSSTQYQYAAALHDLVEPSLGRKLLRDITARDVSRLHHKHSNRPYLANRMIAALSSLFSKAANWGELEKGNNPCEMVQRFPEKKRERFLSESEIQSLGRTLNAAWPTSLEDSDKWSDLASLPRPSPWAIAAIWLLLLTGARRNEILTLKWEDFHDDNRSARLTDSKTGAKTLLFSTAAQEVVRRIPTVEGNPYVIVGRVNGAHLVNLRKPWGNICISANLTDVRLHDLRHTYASYGAMAGLSAPYLMRLLGHAQTQTTERYLHLGPTPVSEANEIISVKVMKIIDSDN